MKDITSRRLKALSALQNRGASMSRLECKEFIFSGKLPQRIENLRFKWKKKKGI